MLSRRSLTAFISCVYLLAGFCAAASSGAVPATPENPRIGLGASLHGAEAVRALGPRLGELAALHQKTPQQLANALLHDSDLWVDPSGRLFFTCQGPSPAALQRAERANAVRASVTAPAPPFPVATTFQLHSRPTSNHKLFLDFDGYTTSNTPWNTGIGDFTSAPFDLDGQSATWSTTEYEAIQHVWQRMSEDYSGFDVDVTTEDPGVEALRRSSPTDQRYGVRVVFSPTDAWIGQNPPGGIAYIGSFTWDTDTPCFVFTANVANNEKYMADAGSHEGGHTLGLLHDGTASLGYYGGQGVWGPIMGAPYDFALTQWCIGDYTGANNQQDDVAVMNTFGITLADDYGSTTATATTLTNNSVTINGIISNRADVDVFRFDTGNGSVKATAVPYVYGPNLDIQIELLSSTGTVLATANPNTLDAALQQTVVSGTYYIRVDGVGAGDPLTTGYSDYGSLGNYTIDISFPTPVPPTAPTKLVATAVAVDEIDVTWTDNATTETGFELERKVDGGNFSRISTPSVNASAFTDRNVTSGSTYTYRVRAVNSGGNSEYSNEASATPPYAPPGTPSLLKLTPIGSTELEVTWQSGGGSITAFELEHRESAGVFSTVDQFNSSTFSTRLVGLAPASNHFLRIRAIGPGGTTGWSNLLAITLPPDAPSDLVVAGLVGGFQVSWNGSGNVTFRLERKVEPGQFVEIAQLSRNTRTYRDTGFSANVTAQYRVRAATTGGVSAYSNVGSATTLTSLKSFIVSSASVKGKKSITGTVTLDAAAPAEGIVVNLSSISEVAAVPASVLIEEGATSATFNISTTKVKRNTKVTLTAAYSGVKKYATFTVKK